MNYEGHGRNLIPMAAYAATRKTGPLSTEHTKHGIMRLYVGQVIAGSITNINVYIPAPNIDLNSLNPAGVLDAVHEAAYYQFQPAAPIAAAGVYPFTVGLGNPLGMSINGYWPPEFEVEVVLSNGSNIKFQLDVLWLG